MRNLFNTFPPSLSLLLITLSYLYTLQRLRRLYKQSALQMDLLSVINTGITIISDIQGFAKSIKHAKAQLPKLRTELSSTQSILDDLKKLVEDIVRAENNRPSGSSRSVDSETGSIQSLLQRNGIQLETLQKTVEGIQKKRLETRSNSNTTIGKRIKQFSNRKREGQEIHQSLKDLSEVTAKASTLCVALSL